MDKNPRIGKRIAATILAAVMGGGALAIAGPAYLYHGKAPQHSSAYLYHGKAPATDWGVAVADGAASPDYLYHG
jgi:hypothetical protein